VGEEGNCQFFGCFEAFGFWGVAAEKRTKKRGKGRESVLKWSQVKNFKVYNFSLVHFAPLR